LIIDFVRIEDFEREADFEIDEFDNIFGCI
jgi:hypothetical protein